MVDGIGPLIAAASGQLGHRLGRSMALCLAVCVCALAGLGFATAAIFLALARSIGPVGASASVAALFGFAAVAIALLARDGSRRRPGRESGADEPRSKAEADAEAIARLAGAFMTGFRAGRGRPRD